MVGEYLACYILDGLLSISLQESGMLWLPRYSFIAFGILYPLCRLGGATDVHRSVVVAKDPLAISQPPVLSSNYELFREPGVSGIIPVTQASLSNLQTILLHTLDSTRLREVLLVCPDSLSLLARDILRNVVAVRMDSAHVDISIHRWAPEAEEVTAVLRVASDLSTVWALVLDSAGLPSFDQNPITTELLLLHTPHTKIPFGPRGFSLDDNATCIVATESLQQASYLIPPFVMSTSLTSICQDEVVLSWQSFGNLVSRCVGEGIGGVVVAQEGVRSWCQGDIGDEGMVMYDVVSGAYEDRTVNESNDDLPRANPYRNPLEPTEYGTFAVMFATLEDLNTFAPVLCHLQDTGSSIHIHLRQSDPTATSNIVKYRHCQLRYHVAPESITVKWLRGLLQEPDVVITLFEMDVAKFPDSAATWIHIPRQELQYCNWMGSLSLSDWQAWNVPRIDVSIITKDRPRSLGRLLASLSQAKFFGDKLDLRVHMEQSSDARTMQMIDEFEWNHGSLFVHRRVIHGGLLPAVVESWYPSSNDSYGLLLEDDVELSPLFYAWLKMTLLRYRYGHIGDRSPQLFGISLYQQKVTELRPQGRRPFNPRDLFSESGIPDFTTPYLSQVPCSWGALYFPEHWREFHDFLSVRLSETVINIDQNIVPNIRSNGWTMSWKKYFIELVYLRGYVMLYPNFEDFISLSTNHLEVGSHVKDRSDERQGLFQLPLMQLPTTSGALALLELPNNRLPCWHSLPVLNLTGMLVSLQTILDAGQQRRTELTECTAEHSPSSSYDVRALWCIAATTS